MKLEEYLEYGIDPQLSSKIWLLYVAVKVWNKKQRALAPQVAPPTKSKVTLKKKLAI